MNMLKTDSVNARKTMETLWSRVRERGDLPGFSKAVSAIIAAMRGDDCREFNMTQTVLSDPALTQKVLRLANSAMYSVFGQSINTISKAVIVLGTETIGHLALGLKLIDGLSAASDNCANARSEMEKAVLAGHIARQMASCAGMRDAEEAVVCSMLHSLGRMMVTFYLPEQWLQVQARCAQAGIDEDIAGQQVLGIGFDDIGRQAAQQWGLPASLVNTMKDMPPKEVDEPLEHADWLAAVSTLSSRCAVALSTDDMPGVERLTRLAGSYADMLGLDASQVLAAVDAAQTVAAEEHAVLVRPSRRSDRDRKTNLPGKPADAATLLARGVADMQEAFRKVSAGQLMTMALETVYQGLGFSRAIAFLHDQEQAQYAARICFGEGVQELLPRLAFSDAYQPDVFHAALSNDKAVFVEHAQAPGFTSKVPRWWKETLPAVRSFLVLPLVIGHRPAGFIYGDWDLTKPAPRIESGEVALLNELRSLVAEIMELHRRKEPGWVRKLV